MRWTLLVALLGACDAHERDELVDARVPDAQLPDAGALDARVKPRMDARADEVPDATLVLPPFARDAMTSTCLPSLVSSDAACPAQFCVGSPLAVGATDSFFITLTPLYSYVKDYGQHLALDFEAGKFDSLRQADQAVVTNIRGATGFRSIGVRNSDDSSIKYRGTPDMIERYTFEAGILHVSGWAVGTLVTAEVPAATPRVCQRDGSVCFTALCDYAAPSAVGFAWIHFDYAGEIMGIE